LKGYKMAYKSKIEVNLTFADHRVICYFAEKHKVSRVAAIQLMLDSSPLFNECLDELKNNSESFMCDFEEREEEMIKKRKKIGKTPS